MADSITPSAKNMRKGHRLVGNLSEKPEGLSVPNAFGIEERCRTSRHDRNMPLMRFYS